MLNKWKEKHILARNSELEKILTKKETSKPNQLKKTFLVIKNKTNINN